MASQVPSGVIRRLAAPCSNVELTVSFRPPPDPLWDGLAGALGGDRTAGGAPQQRGGDGGELWGGLLLREHRGRLQEAHFRARVQARPGG
eukprot:998809-Prorocentrum_minimum.AAC.2